MTTFTCPKETLFRRLTLAVTSVLVLVACLWFPATLAQGSPLGPQRLSEPWGAFAGIGYSGSTFGRQIPGIHLAAHARDLEISFYSTGFTSEIATSSHQNVLVGWPFLVRETSWLSLRNTVGIGSQWNQRTLRLGPDDPLKRSHEQVWGPGFAATACVVQHVCLRIEAFLGLQLDMIQQIYHENAMGSIGVSL